MKVKKAKNVKSHIEQFFMPQTAAAAADDNNNDEAAEVHGKVGDGGDWRFNKAKES